MSFIRRSTRVLAIVGIVIVVVLALGVVAIETPWFKGWLRGFAVRQASSTLNGQLSIGGLSGSLFTGVTLSDVSIQMDGRPVVTANRIEVDYNPVDLILHGVDLDRIEIDHPVVHLRRTKDGWNVATLFEPTATSTGPAAPIVIDAVIVNDGTVFIEDTTPPASRAVRLPERIEAINAKLSYRSASDYLDARVDRLSAHARQPALDLTALSGTLTEVNGNLTLDRMTLQTAHSGLHANGTVKGYQSQAPEVDLSLRSDGIAIDEISPFVPALAAIHLRPTFSVRAHGPARHVLTDFQVTAAPAGSLNGHVTADISAPARQAQGDIHLQHVNAAPIAGRAYASDITAEVTFDLTLPAERGPTGHYAISAPEITAAGYRLSDLSASGTVAGPRVTVDAHARAYGTRATVQGTIVRAPELSYDVTGTLRGANLRALPGSLKLPDLRSDLNADLHVAGHGDAMKGEVTVATSHLAGATIIGGTRATFSKAGTRIAYTANGGIHGLDIQRVGRALHLRALAADRYRSAINARFTVDGRGTSLPALTADLTATLSDSTLLGGQVPHFSLQAHLDRGALRAQVTGAFNGLDPAAIASRPAFEGAVSGTMDLTAAVANIGDPLNPADVTADGRITLTDSSVGSFRFESAVLGGRFADRIGHIRQLAVSGPDLNARVTGTLSLTEGTASNLTYHMDTSNLGAIGALVHQPVKGSLRVDGHVTGTRAALQTHGNLTATNLAYGSNQVLSLTSTFDARVPDLQVARGRYQTNADATFVKVAGQAINELTLNAVYESKRLTFQTTARQAPRQVQAAGVLMLYPDAAELQLRQLALSTTGQQWDLASGTQSVISYGEAGTEIRSLTLVSGNQRLSVDGVIAPAGNALNASAANIDLTGLQKLLLIQRHIAGRLDASVHLTGTSKAPVVDATLNIADGAFRAFTFRSAGGTAHYGPHGIALDMRLQENPAAWLTVSGTAPMSLFSSSTGETGATGQAPVDLTIDTSTIHLGVVQGVTTALDQVRGTVQAHLHIGGTGLDPHAEGSLAINDGAFTIPAVGTSYSGMNVRLDFVPDYVRIHHFVIADADGHTLRVGGELAVHAKHLGAVKVDVSADNFQILDGDLAAIGVDAHLGVTGQVMQPHVTGSITVREGRLNLAQLLQQVGSSPYSTHPLAAPVSAAEAADAREGKSNTRRGSRGDAEARSDGSRGGATVAATEQEGSRGDAGTAEGSAKGLAIDVRIHIPDNFVITGNNLRPGGSSFAVGDVNLTLGGDLHVIKPPGGELRLNGVITTVRGQYIFQGREFQIARNGHIRFENAFPPDPALDIVATRTIQGVEARIHVGGTVTAPQLTLSSEPPLDEGDILSLIVFNQPTNQLGAGQRMSLAERARGLALSFVAGSLTRSLGNALGVDMFRIEAAPTGGGGPQVTVGQQLTNGLYVQVQQEVGAGSATQFQLEYRFTDFMRLRAEANTGSQVSQSLLHRVQQEGIDLIFFFSY